MARRGFVAGTILGAGLVYFLDPALGDARRRRAGRGLAGWISGRLTAGVGRPRYGARLGDLAGLEYANLSSTGYGSRELTAIGIAALGGAFTLYGFARRGGPATLARAVGAGLLARRAARRGDDSGRERRRVVDIQKSIHIDAPVADVFGLWDRYASFPRFLPGVRDVADLGGGRARWVVTGPGGRAIEWETVLTRRIPGRLLAWRSEPGSMLDHAGAIRFTPERGGTKADLRICYQPPVGRADEAVTVLLGADPRSRLNDDLERLKGVLEQP